MHLGLDIISYSLAAGLGNWQPANNPVMQIGHFIQKAAEMELQEVGISDFGLFQRSDYGYFSSLRRSADDAGVSLQLTYAGMRSEHLQDAVRIGAALNCKLLVFEPQIERPVSEQSMEVKLQDLFDMIDAALAAAERYQINLALSGGGLTVHEMLQIGQAAQSDHFGFALDPLAALRVLECPVQWAQQLGPRLLSAKLSDFEAVWESSGARLYHCPLGEGFVDVEETLALVGQLAPEARLLISTPLSSALLPFLDGLFLERLHHLHPAQLARIVRIIKEHARLDPPGAQTEGPLSEDEILAQEEDRFQKSLDWVRRRPPAAPEAATEAAASETENPS